MRVLVCGDREWRRPSAVMREIAKLQGEGYHITMIGHGDCRGADRCGGLAARLIGVKEKRYPADWRKHGRAAGPIRNREMARRFKPHIALVFHPDLSRSKGTRDMVRVLESLGVPYRYFRE